MGNIEQIEELETYIKELGEEIVKVKKASDYLKLIEDFQAEVKKTSSTLNQSNDQLKLFQKIVESKLELFHTTAQNIENKQQSVEHSLTAITAGLENLKKQQEKNEEGIVNSFQEMNKLVNEKHNAYVGELTKAKEEQTSVLMGVSKANKIFFSINMFFSISIIVILVLWVMR